MYYTSCTLQGAKSRYPRIEKLAFALITSARQLQPYFQAHTIVVLIDKLLQKILSRSETSGRLMKWAFELEEFEVVYRPMRAIKGQAVADFLAEFTYSEDSIRESAQPDLLPEL